MKTCTKAVNILRSNLPAKDRLVAVLRDDMIHYSATRGWTAWCAHQVLELEREAGREHDEKCWIAKTIAWMYADMKADIGTMKHAEREAFDVARRTTDGNANKVAQLCGRTCECDVGFFYANTYRIAELSVELGLDWSVIIERLAATLEANDPDNEDAGRSGKGG